MGIEEWSLLAFVLAVVLVVPLLVYFLTREKREAARRKRHSEWVARWYGRQIVDLCDESQVLFASILDLSATAEEHLDQAEIDFKEGVIAPFWDCVERAAQTLGHFDERVRQMSGNLSRYTKLVRRYEADTGQEISAALPVAAPPEFPLSQESVKELAVGRKTAERMKVIVRKAQRDGWFAMIYEQRKTNQILVAGFTDLAQGLEQMTWCIATSIGDLASSIDAMGDDD
jgi:hypothetical protein